MDHGLRREKYFKNERTTFQIGQNLKSTTYKIRKELKTNNYRIKPQLHFFLIDDLPVSFHET
jgi:hypothetical protein